MAQIIEVKNARLPVARPAGAAAIQG